MQLHEAAGLIATSQTILRFAPFVGDMKKDEFSMEIDGQGDRAGTGGKGGSSGVGGGEANKQDEEEKRIVGDLGRNLRDSLPDGEDGQRGLLVKLRGMLQGEFGDKD